jgi:hypothetical protein
MPLETSEVLFFQYPPVFSIGVQNLNPYYDSVHWEMDTLFE